MTDKEAWKIAGIVASLSSSKRSEIFHSAYAYPEQIFMSYTPEECEKMIREYQFSINLHEGMVLKSEDSFLGPSLLIVLKKRKSIQKREEEYQALIYYLEGEYKDYMDIVDFNKKQLTEEGYKIIYDINIVDEIVGIKKKIKSFLEKREKENENE